MVLRFARWYLSPVSRIGRGGFNALVFLAAIPPFFLPTGKESSGGGISSLDPQILLQMTQRDQYSDPADIYAHAESLRESVRGSGLESLSGQLLYGSEQVGVNWAAVGLLGMFILLLPIFHMRLRDMGKTDSFSRWVYIALIYGSVVLSAIAGLLKLDLPNELYLAVGAPSFVILSWLCMSATHYVPPSKRGGPML